jgi:Mlc titration factor MtfA (ptsG expression regulator)
MFSTAKNHAAIHEVLQRRFPYFREMEAADRPKFVKRLSEFIHIREFEGRKGLDVSPEIKILISATAIQLTFGLEEYLLPRFATVIVYPYEYYSGVSRSYHKGEANIGGAIVLSWKDFEDGIEDEHDKLNLGLHEWAHALMLENRIGEGRDPIFSEYIDKWQSEAQPVFQKVDEIYSDVFRHYGATNISEFFSVCMEVFFEDPGLFSAKTPELFRHTCILLNQYPLHNRTALEPEQPKADAFAFYEHFSAENAILPIEPAWLAFALSTLLPFAVAWVFGYAFHLELTLLLAATAYLMVRLFFFLRDEILLKNALYIFGDKIQVQGKSKVKAAYRFDQLAGMDISGDGHTVDISFNYPLGSSVETDTYRFHFNSGSIQKMRDALRNKNIPVKLVRYRTGLWRQNKNF